MKVRSSVPSARKPEPLQKLAPCDHVAVVRAEQTRWVRQVLQIEMRVGPERILRIEDPLVHDCLRVAIHQDALIVAAEDGVGDAAVVRGLEIVVWLDDELRRHARGRTHVPPGEGCDWSRAYSGPTSVNTTSVVGKRATNREQMPRSSTLSASSMKGTNPAWLYAVRVPGGTIVRRSS